VGPRGGRGFSATAKAGVLEIVEEKWKKGYLALGGTKNEIITQEIRRAGVQGKVGGGQRQAVRTIEKTEKNANEKKKCRFEENPLAHEISDNRSRQSGSEELLGGGKGGTMEKKNNKEKGGGDS